MLNLLLLEPVLNLEPSKLKYLTESDQMDRTQPRNIYIWSVPPTITINIGTSMRYGTIYYIYTGRRGLDCQVSEGERF